MKSIAYSFFQGQVTSSGSSHYAQRVLQMEDSITVQFGTFGASVKRKLASCNIKDHHLTKEKRHTREKGDITTFSAQSARRLKRLVYTVDLKAKPCLVSFYTVTLPWAADPDTVRAIWHRFNVNCNQDKRLKPVSIIWRAELTSGEFAVDGKRRWHCHMIVLDYTPEWDDEFRKGHRFNNAHGKVWAVDEVYRSAVESVYQEMNGGMPLEDGLNRRQLKYWGETAEEWYMNQKDGTRRATIITPVEISDCTEHGKLVAYIAASGDHMGKHKSAQLGWIGRQWGVINRRNIVFGRIEERKTREWDAAALYSKLETEQMLANAPIVDGRRRLPDGVYTSNRFLAYGGSVGLQDHARIEAFYQRELVEPTPDDVLALMRWDIDRLTAARAGKKADPSGVLEFGDRMADLRS